MRINVGHTIVVVLSTAFLEFLVWTCTHSVSTVFASIAAWGILTSVCGVNVGAPLTASTASSPAPPPAPDQKA